MRSKIALWYLIVVFLFSWGFLSARYHIFPWSLIDGFLITVENFVKGDPFDDTPLARRVVAEFKEDTAQFEADNHPGFANGKPLSPDFFDPEQKGLPLFFTEKTSGYYMVYGIFKAASNGLAPYAILIDLQGDVVRSWHLPFLGQSKESRRIFISREGDLITNNSDALRCYSWCGDLKWEIPPSGFHHELDEWGDKLYLWRWDTVVSVDKKDQSVTTILRMIDLVMNNPDVVELRMPLTDEFRYFEEARETSAVDDKDPNLAQKTGYFRGRDPYHPNTVSVNKGVCPLFPPDALLLSFRHIDTVMVVDPKTARVLWIDHFNRQHYPLWRPDGITVYNNRTNFRHSTIEYVNFDKERTILADGKDFRWHRTWTGNYSFLDDGSLLFLANHSEFYHLDESGGVLSRFVNRFNALDLTIVNAYFVDEESYKRFESACTKSR